MQVWFLIRNVGVFLNVSLCTSRVYYILRCVLIILLPALFRVLIFSVSALLSARVLVMRKTLEESIFLASSQVCGMYVLNLVFGFYRTILTTMHRERWTALSDSPCDGLDLESDAQEHEDTPDADVELTTIETASSLAHIGTADRSIYFRTRETLRQHILDVHHMGYALLVLFVAMDFGHEWVSVVFCGSVLSFQFYDEMTRQVEVKFRLIAVWVFVLCVAAFIFGLQFGKTVSQPLSGWENFPLTFSLFFFLLSVLGCAWAAKRPVFGIRPSGGGTAVRELTIDAKHTCFIIALPLAFILYRAGVVVVPETSLDIFFLCVLEPSLRLLCVVMFIMSVCAGRTQELVLVLAVAMLIKLCDTEHMETTHVYVFIILLSLLLLTHAGRSYHAAHVVA